MIPRTGAWASPCPRPCPDPRGLRRRRAARVDDEDATLGVALAKSHRLAHGRGWRDGTDRRDMTSRREAGSCDRTLGGERALTRVLEAVPRDRRGSLRVAAAAERAGDRSGVDGLRAAANDDEDPAVHLDQEHERARVREVDDLVRQVRDAVDVLGPGDAATSTPSTGAAAGSRSSMRCLRRSRSMTRGAYAGIR